MKTICTVCGKRFMPDKEAVYLVSETGSLIEAFTKATNVVDAVDCPRCGCQQLLKIRLPKIEERGARNEAESET